MDYEALGKRIKQFRRLKGLTQLKLAEKMDVSVSHISNLENANTKPSVDTLVEICNAFEITSDQLLCDSLDYEKNSYYREMEELFKGCSKQEIQLITEIARVLRKHLT